jgi:uncharacterized protein
MIPSGNEAKNRLIKVRGDSFYFLDVLSNEVIRVPKGLYDLLDENGSLQVGGSEEIGNEDIFKLEQRFSRNVSCVHVLPPSIFYRNERFDLSNFLANHCRQLMLEITERCNLRCSYCIFSQGYSHFRKHGSGSLSSVVAKKAIRDFLDRSVGSNAISFFGGEPLLEFSLLQDIVEFAIEYGEKIGKKPVFALTTNGTLLMPSIANYLIERNF